MDDTGWAVVEKLPLSNLERMYQTVVRTTVLLILASIALLFILYYFSSRTIAQPIRQLKHTMDQIKAGNLDARVDITTGDELGMLADGLNQMTEQLQQHIDKVYLSEIRQQEAELSALMTQIQPHYLYNTLDAIRMSSITHDDLDTARMLKSLSLQMRYLISDSRNLVTLKEELNSIRNYFIITQIKYEDQVQLEINADDNTLQCRIPRLSLQPIIENSVKYGIAPKGGGRIAIYAKEDQGNLLITILDDGVGMDPNMLDKANRILKGDLIQEKSGEEKYSIGLKNIEDRIKLQFGSLYGITIRSTPQLGTLVYVTLPMIDEEEV